MVFKRKIKSRNLGSKPHKVMSTKGPLLNSHLQPHPSPWSVADAAVPADAEASKVSKGGKFFCAGPGDARILAVSGTGVGGLELFDHL